MRKNILVTLLASLFLSACGEVNTDNPEKAYSYWSDGMPTKEVKVIDGKYWQSGHWTKEYEVYLHMNVSRLWWSEFIKQNNLQPGAYAWERDDKTPKWFKPSKSSVQYNGGGLSQYFWDSINHECYLHEMQL